MTALTPPFHAHLPPPQAERMVRFYHLVAGGWSVEAAAATVGVDPDVGRIWLALAARLAPPLPPAAAKRVPPAPAGEPPPAAENAPVPEGKGPRYITVEVSGLRRIVRADGQPLGTGAPAPPAPEPEPAAAPGRFRPGPVWKQPRREVPPAPAATGREVPVLPTPRECRAWRRAQGLSQRDLAELLGVARSMVAAVELGVRRAEALRLKLAKLMEKK